MRIEKGVDRGASVLFACAAAYAAYGWFVGRSAPPLVVAQTAAMAALAYLLCIRALSAVPVERRKLPVAVFDVRDIEPIAAPELLLTETYESPKVGSDDALVLDDILTELEPDSRVVRLFDPAAMPTPGQLNDRIERHLVRDAPPGSSHDASQALHEALAELRRSLR